MTSVTIRPASVEDASAVRAVAQRSLTAACDGRAPETIRGAVDEAYDGSALRRAIQRPEVATLVACVDGGADAAGDPAGDVVGYVSGVQTARREGHLPALCVAPGRWREGIGTALAERAISALHYRGVRRLELSVLADDEPGIAFCESRGFERAGRQATPLGDHAWPGYVYASELDG